MASGRKRKANSTTPASPDQSSKTGTVEGNKAATWTSPRRSNDSKTGAQLETTTVPSASSPKESMTTSSPSHNQQTQDVGNKDWQDCGRKQSCYSD